MAQISVEAIVTGKVWKIEVGAGASVAAGDTLLILESMKMEIPIEAPVAGRVREILVALDDAVDEGQVVAVLEA
jgi:acetyl-CoA carboxylase biotin carboxyl carrier protein